MLPVIHTQLQLKPGKRAGLKARHSHIRVRLPVIHMPLQLKPGKSRAKTRQTQREVV